jgi:hypothetical protein
MGLTFPIAFLLKIGWPWPSLNSIRIKNWMALAFPSIPIKNWMAWPSLLRVD